MALLKELQPERLEYNEASAKTLELLASFLPWSIAPKCLLARFTTHMKR
jgi:hypothetical protein